MIAETRVRRYPLWLIRSLRMALFAVVIAVSAKISIPIPGTPVPITMQVLAVLVTGMALGPIEGALSVIGYLAAIGLGLPLDANSLGQAVFAGPTAGYLLGFVPGAAIAGLAWHVTGKSRFVLSLVLGVIALGAIYLVGMVGLLPFMQGSWAQAFAKGVVPFVPQDLGKVLLAASIAQLGRESWLRWILPRLPSGDRSGS